MEKFEFHLQMEAPPVLLPFSSKSLLFLKNLTILSHPAVGGFLTHCGWNSTLEGICSGLPLITWPFFADQFCNEKLVVQVAKTGVRSGVKQPLVVELEEEVPVLVKKEDVRNAIEQLMDGGKEAEERRKRARELAEMAKKAVEVGGSSHRNITQLIRDIMQQSLVKDLRST